MRCGCRSTAGSKRVDIATEARMRLRFHGDNIVEPGRCGVTMTLALACLLIVPLPLLRSQTNMPVAMFGIRVQS
jgi:hypothetical protein